MSYIVKLCIYENTEIHSDYIGYSAKFREHNRDVYKCVDKPFANFKDYFYAVDPYFSTIPPGMVIFYARDTEVGSYRTVKFDQLYDPFELQQNDVRFMAWAQPTPSTTPLYVYQRGDNFRFSFEKQDYTSEEEGKSYVELPYSPIYVLTEPSQKKRILPSIGSKNFEIKEGVPQFKFSGYQGRCLPDPDGVDIGECVALYVKNITDPHKSYGELLYHIQEQNKQYEQYHRKKITFSEVGIVLAGLFLIFSVVYLSKILKMKKK